MSCAESIQRHICTFSTHTEPAARDAYHVNLPQNGWESRCTETNIVVSFVTNRTRGHKIMKVESKCCCFFQRDIFDRNTSRCFSVNVRQIRDFSTLPTISSCPVWLCWTGSSPAASIGWSQTRVDVCLKLWLLPWGFGSTHQIIFSESGVSGTPESPSLFRSPQCFIVVTLFTCRRCLSKKTHLGCSESMESDSCWQRVSSECTHTGRAREESARTRSIPWKQLAQESKKLQQHRHFDEGPIFRWAQETNSHRDARGGSTGLGGQGFYPWRQHTFFTCDKCEVQGGPEPKGILSPPVHVALTPLFMALYS